MDGLRQAALKLHGMSATDRRWILGQLDAATERRLHALLQDLDAAGLDPVQVAAVSRNAVREEPARTAAPRSSALRADTHAQLDQVDAGVIERVLANEPGWVATAILSAHPWSWRDAVAARLKAGRSAGIAHPMYAAQRLKGPMIGALADAVARRVEEEQAAADSKFERTMDNLEPLVRNGRVGGKARHVWARLRRWIP